MGGSPFPSAQKAKKKSQNKSGAEKCSHTSNVVELAMDPPPNALKKGKESQWSRTNPRWVQGMIMDDHARSGDQRRKIHHPFFSGRDPKITPKKRGKTEKRQGKDKRSKAKTGVIRRLTFAELSRVPEAFALKGFGGRTQSRADKVGA